MTNTIGPDPSERSMEEVQGLAIAPYSKELLRSSQEYVHTAGLPAGSLVSVCLAVASHNALERKRTSEARMPREEQRRLIRTTAKPPLSDKELGIVLSFGNEQGFPLSLLYAFRQRGELVLGVLSEGLKLRVQADPRILRSITSEEAGLWNMGPRLLLRMVARVEFWNGEVYVGRAGASTDAAQVKERGLDVLISLAETRARSRAMRMALRLPFTQDEEAPSGDLGPEAGNVHDLAQARFGLGRKEINRLLGLDDTADEKEAILIFGSEEKVLQAIEEAHARIR